MPVPLLLLLLILASLDALPTARASFFCEQAGTFGRPLYTNATVRSIATNTMQRYRIRPPVRLGPNGLHPFLGGIDRAMHAIFGNALLRTQYAHEGDNMRGYRVEVRALFVNPPKFVQKVTWNDHERVHRTVRFCGSCVSASAVDGDQ